MFSNLDRSTGSISYVDENKPGQNAHTIIAAIILLPLVEPMHERMHELMMKVSDLQHLLSPVGGSPPGATP